MKKWQWVWMLGLCVALWATGCGSDDADTDGDVDGDSDGEQAVAGLELIGLDGSTDSLDWDALQELDATEGHGGWLTSVGTIVGPNVWKGVSVADLCDRVGGLPQGAGVKITASDDYAMTLSSDQLLNGALPTFDPESGDSLDYAGELTAIIAYEREGGAIGDDDGGPLRLAFVSSEADQLTDGHWWIKMVAKIEILEMGSDWTLDLEGARDETMDRATFESGAAMGCHGYTWTDSHANVWSGIPLWLLVGRVDDDNVHDEEAYNRDLAAQGYSVRVVGDGAEVAFESGRLTENDDILLAYLINDVPLEGDEAPLKLVGADLDADEMLGGITRVVLELPE